MSNKNNNLQHTLVRFENDIAIDSTILEDYEKQSIVLSCEIIGEKHGQTLFTYIEEEGATIAEKNKFNFYILELRT